MKKYLLSLVVTVIMFAGCKLDEAGFPKKGESLILGKWYNKSTTTFTPAQNGAPANTYTYADFTANDYISFTSNNATMSESFTNSVTTFKYLVLGSTLTLTSNDNPPEIETQTITKLTTDSLVLVSNGTADAGGPVTTFTVTDRYARK
ncbi:hypothetical protein GCM10027049_22880 [Mucilaginibacter puniceus]